MSIKDGPKAAIALRSSLGPGSVLAGEGGGKRKKRGETAKNRRAVLFPLSRLPFDSLSLADFFRLFCPVLSLVPGSLRSESGDNKNQLCGVSITCNWGPLLL